VRIVPIGAACRRTNTFVTGFGQEVGVACPVLGLDVVRQTGCALLRATEFGEDGRGLLMVFGEVTVGWCLRRAWSLAPTVVFGVER
jgi:hypothetical protein